MQCVKSSEESFVITGMSCSACSAHVERAVGQLAGIESVQVNLLTGTMKVRFHEPQNAANIIRAVEAAGYGAKAGPAATTPQSQTAILKKRFTYSAVLLLPLVAVHHLWHDPVSAMVQLLLTLPILWLNRKFFIAGTKSVMSGAANMDTLVALGAATAMADGIANFFLHHRGAFYFESAAMILTFITLGKWLETRATGRTGKALEKLLTLIPQTATVLKEDGPVTIAADGVQAGDTLLIRAGERIPTDGTVLAGCSTADEAVLTGESMPAEKTPGCSVYAGSINGNGVLTVRADKTRADSAISDIIRLVGEASATKAPIARIADRISAVFVPVVVSIALITATAWILAGAGVAFAVSSAIAVLVISCPCALGLATPVAIMVGTGRGAEAGILFRNGTALETLHAARAILLDKTGTLTQGKPQVAEVIPAEGTTEAELMQLAVSMENAGNHPLAAAIVRAGTGIPPQTASKHTYIPGRGITAQLNGTLCAAGNALLMQELGVNIPQHCGEQAAAAGKTPLYFSRGKEYVGLITLADTLKPDSHAAVSELQTMGSQVIMLTGDNTLTAQTIAQQAGITEVHADLLPQDKEACVRRLQHAALKVAMVGDGINDAPALTRADVGIAIGAGTDVALESAGVILVRNTLTDVVGAIRLSHAVIRNIKQNFFWALLYNSLAIPLAAGVFYPLLGWQLHPAVAAAAMGLSSLCVVTNALRLRHFHITPPQKMNTITISVDGMMCPHCEAHVTKALLAIAGVVDCKADHKAKRVTLTLSKEIPLAELHATIRAQGYQVL